MFDPPDVLPRVAAVLRDVLGADLAGAYLHGSAVLDGLRPRSDLDVLAVAHRPLTPVEKHRLVGRLIPLSGGIEPGLPLPLEVTIAPAGDLRPWRYPPRVDFKYGEWLRPRFAQGNYEPETSHDRDLAVVVTVTRGAGRPLAGPPAVELLDPVPHADVVDASVRGVPGLLADLDWDLRNVLLTLTRIWCTLQTGEIRSKEAAAGWALERLPDAEPLARARAIHIGDEEERWDDLQKEARRLADALSLEIRRSAADA